MRTYVRLVVKKSTVQMQRAGENGVNKGCVTALWVGREASGTHQVLPMTRVPAGRNKPSYQSSAVSLWGIARCQGVKYNNRTKHQRWRSQHLELWRTQWNHGMPTERLLEDRRHIGQQWPVPKIGKAVLAHYPINFRLRSSLYLGIENHREEERMEHRHSLRGSEFPINRIGEPGLTVSCAPIPKRCTIRTSGETSPNVTTYQCTLLPVSPST
jgi:hypothetical protein